MQKILLGVTGSVAAKLTAKLVRLLLEENYAVQIVATDASAYFWSPADVNVPIFRDADEWPGEIYVKDQIIPHIALRDWADLFLIAPLTANTLAKLANGICDNLITSVARAWPLAKPLIVAPSMNTQMWLHPLTNRHIANLIEDYRAEIVPPIEKKLACGEQGVGAMAELTTILIALNEALGKTKEGDVSKN